MVQRKCKSNAISSSSLECIAEMQPFLSKDTRHKIVEVKVDGIPSPAQDLSGKEELQQEHPHPNAPSPVRILLELLMTNGLHISQKNLSYQELKLLIGKLEVLC